MAAVAAARAAAVQEVEVGLAEVAARAAAGQAVAAARAVAGQRVEAERVEGPAASPASPGPGERLPIRASMLEAPLG